jgi:hypothetical protein
MSAQPETPGPFWPQIPRTINAISAALTDEKRAEFRQEALAAEQGSAFDAVMNRWWMEAMLDRVPGREQRLADALAGRNLVPLSELVEKTE